MTDTSDPYQELYAYTMGRARFILQHVVDAQHAQAATSGVNSIGLVFGLVGLYLHLEKGFDGKQVQRAHQTLGARKRTWPDITLPARRGSVTAADVLAAAAGPDRDEAIDRWCQSVWAEFQSSRPVVIALLEEYGIA